MVLGVLGGGMYPFPSARVILACIGRDISRPKKNTLSGLLKESILDSVWLSSHFFVCRGGPLEGHLR